MIIKERNKNKRNKKVKNSFNEGKGKYWKKVGCHRKFRFSILGGTSPPDPPGSLLDVPLDPCLMCITSKVNL